MHKLIIMTLFFMSCGSGDEGSQDDRSLSSDAIAETDGAKKQETLALVSVGTLVGVEFDALKIRIRKGENKNIFKTLNFPSGKDSVDFSLEPGPYSFQLDYLLDKKVIYSSSFCSEEQKESQKHTLLEGMNQIQINICSGEGTPMADVSIDPILIE